MVILGGWIVDICFLAFLTLILRNSTPFARIGNLSSFSFLGTSCLWNGRGLRFRF